VGSVASRFNDMPIILRIKNSIFLKNQSCSTESGTVKNIIELRKFKSYLRASND
jgi:hypothetical protein